MGQTLSVGTFLSEDADVTTVINRQTFLSSPSPCQISGASKNQEYSPFFPVHLSYLLLWCYSVWCYLVLVPWGLTNFFDSFLWRFFLTKVFLTIYFYEFFDKFLDKFFRQIFWQIFWRILIFRKIFFCCIFVAFPQFDHTTNLKIKSWMESSASILNCEHLSAAIYCTIHNDPKWRNLKTVPLNFVVNTVVIQYCVYYEI